jgi:hypothetical protein
MADEARLARLRGGGTAQAVQSAISSNWRTHKASQRRKQAAPIFEAPLPEKEDAKSGRPEEALGRRPSISIEEALSKPGPASPGVLRSRAAVANQDPQPQPQPQPQPEVAGLGREAAQPAPTIGGSSLAAFNVASRGPAAAVTRYQLRSETPPVYAPSALRTLSARGGKTFGQAPVAGVAAAAPLGKTDSWSWMASSTGVMPRAPQADAAGPLNRTTSLVAQMVALRHQSVERSISAAQYEG